MAQTIIPYTSTIAVQPNGKQIKVSVFKELNSHGYIQTVKAHVGRYEPGSGHASDGLILSIEDLQVIERANSFTRVTVEEDHSLEIDFFDDDRVDIKMLSNHQLSRFVVNKNVFKSLKRVAPALRFIIEGITTRSKFNIAKDCVISLLSDSIAYLYETNAYGGSLESDIGRARDEAVANMQIVERTLGIPPRTSTSIFNSSRLPSCLSSVPGDWSESRTKMVEICRIICRNEN